MVEEREKLIQVDFIKTKLQRVISQVSIHNRKCDLDNRNDKGDCHRVDRFLTIMLYQAASTQTISFIMKQG